MAALGAQVVEQSDATLKLRVADAMVDVVQYPYAPLIRPQPGPEGVRVAGLRDLATMKLAAIARRGVRRDYWDLHEILTRTPLGLRRVCDDYLAKFGVSQSDHVLRALTWFEDAEADPPPRGPPRGPSLRRWRAIQAWYESAAAREVVHRSS